MRFFAALAQLALVAVPSIAAPSSLKTVAKYNGDVKANSYIIRLKGDVSTESISISSESTVTHRYSIINGFAGDFTEEDLNELRANGNVESIEENGIMKTFVTQNDAPWGLGRISSTDALPNQTDSALNFTYDYDGSGGTGVDVYVVDTGIFTDHPAFEGRASWGKTFGGYNDADGNGHGTHCAGTIASAPYGVSKNVSVIAVKVLSDEGSGEVADIVSGLEWVGTQASSTGKPTVVSMSLGGGAAAALDQAVAVLTSAGIHVAVAAGNNGSDAGSTSPAREPSAITVGASTIDDKIASFSNYGSVVDVFAPGFNIISTWNDGKNKSISGTSMATPHVAGLIAYLLGLNGTSSPSDISNTLKSLAISDALSGVPSGTANLLINNGFSA